MYMCMDMDMDMDMDMYLYMCIRICICRYSETVHRTAPIEMSLAAYNAAKRGKTANLGKTATAAAGEADGGEAGGGESYKRSAAEEEVCLYIYMCMCMHMYIYICIRICICRVISGLRRRRRSVSTPHSTQWHMCNICVPSHVHAADALVAEGCIACACI